MKKKIELIFVTLVFFLLSACSQTADLSFSQSQAWKLESKSTYDPELFNSLSDSVESLGLGITLDNLDESAIEMGMSSLKSYCNQAGVDMNWRRGRTLSGDVTLSVSLSGDRLEQLSQLGQGAITVTEEAPGRFHLISQGFDLSQYASDLPVEMMGVIDSEFRLHTGGILSSNADKVSGNTAIWYNPAGMDAVFNAGGIGLAGLGPILAIAGGGLALVGIIAAIANRKKTCFACEARIPARARVCPNCGEELEIRSQEENNDY